MGLVRPLQPWDILWFTVITKKVSTSLAKTSQEGSLHPVLMSMSETFSVLLHKSPEWSSLVPDPEAESSEIQNPISFTMSYQYCHHHFVSYVCFQFCLFLSGRYSKHVQHPNKSFKRIFCDSSKATFSSNFPGSPVIATSPSNAGSAHLVSSQGAKIPHASLPKKRKRKEKKPEHKPESVLWQIQ